MSELELSCLLCRFELKVPGASHRGMCKQRAVLLVTE